MRQDYLGQSFRPRRILVCLNMAYPRVAKMRTVEAFRERLAELELPIQAEDSIETAPESPLAQALDVDGFRVGNRFVIHPMEGWDAGTDGMPSDYVRRRWKNFGLSGAKWIWGGEAMAVTPDARANPHQLIINESTRDELARLHEILRESHRETYGNDNDLLVGFQLTHSGRFCKPREQDKAEPQILYKHPILNRKFGLGDDYPILSDNDIRGIVELLVRAAKIAESCGAQFVDIKHCHGYLGHEFLSARERPGPYGGSFENRTRFLREVVEGIRGATSLKIGVRLSAIDMVPYRPDPEQSEGLRLGPGIPEPHELPYTAAFGVDAAEPTSFELSEPARFLALLNDLGIKMVNLTGGSPYYNPHSQRPALFPPSDGYQPPEDPLVGCARLIDAHGRLKANAPDLVTVGTGYSYFQQFLPHVAQWAVRSGKIDAVGLGRMVLPYPDLPNDVLTDGALVKKKLCRTFSDCTTGPRNGLISGCYPLDPFYRKLPEAKIVFEIKSQL